MFEDHVARFRLRRHHLLTAGTADPVTICRDICCAQAQLTLCAHLQLRARNPRITRAEIDNALWKSRALVKTWVMRRTLHYVPADEFAMYIAALRASRVRALFNVMQRCGITAAESDKLTELIVSELAAGPASQTAIRAAVRPKVKPHVRKWMDKVSSIVQIPIAEGLICYGGGEGNAMKFVRTETWLPKVRRIGESDAQATLLRKYLRTYGPATAHDFAHWTGMSVKQSSRVFEQLKDEVVEAAGGWILIEDEKALSALRREGDAGVKLLPSFDPFLLAHSTKHHLVEEQHYKRVFQRLAWIAPVILVDGRVVGTWKHKADEDQLNVEIAPFDKLSRSVLKGIEAEAAGIAD
ncbi:MAG TPA: winged helix DNA-binding domain-containing protein, partial [Candidatus Solibacter sp.]|nr:winged helix DNA-binding domain-containing protein [Candidatus Solibacter sp.]